MLPMKTKKFGSKKLRTNNGGGVLDTNLIFKKKEKNQKLTQNFALKKCIILYNNTPKNDYIQNKKVKKT